MARGGVHPLSGPAPPRSLRSLRLAFKRAFTDYYVLLCGPGVADPTEAFGSALEYLWELRRQLGPQEFMRRLDDETTHLVGEVEQDLRRRLRDRDGDAGSEAVEDRLRECFEYALGRLEVLPSHPD